MAGIWKVAAVVAMAVLVLAVVALVLTRIPVASARVSGPTPVVASSAQATVPVGAENGGISVTGQGKVKAKPDVAYINLGVSSTGATAKEAMDQNSTAMNSVIAKLTALGIDKKDMHTGNISLSPQTQTPKTGETGTPRSSATGPTIR